MTSEYRPIGKTNYLHHQSQIQTLQQHHNPRELLPQTVVNGKGEEVDNLIAVPQDTLEKLLFDELRCPICLGIFDNTITLSTCMHRFCSECFQRSMRELKSQHGCPQCRAKLASRRVSKLDTTVDQIIRTFQRYLPSSSHTSQHTGALFHPSNPSNAPLLNTTTQTSSQPIATSTPQQQAEIADPSNSSTALNSPQSAAAAAVATVTGKRGRKAMTATDVIDQEIEQVFEIEKFRRAYLQRVEEFKQRQKEMKEKGFPNTSSYHTQFFSSQRSKQGRGSSNKSARTSYSSSSSSYVSQRVFLALLPEPYWKPDEEVLPSFQNNEHVSSADFSLRLPYLKVNAELNIGELKQFLQIKLQLRESAYTRLEIVFPRAGGQSLQLDGAGAEKWVVLDEGLTVIDAMEALWNRTSELIFYYRLSEKNVAGTVMMEDDSGRDYPIDT